MRHGGDFKGTLNPHLIVDHYPLPKVEDAFATLGPGEKFNKLDLKQARWKLDDESKQYLTITTSKGLFQYNSSSIWCGFSASDFSTNT